MRLLKAGACALALLACASGVAGCKTLGLDPPTAADLTRDAMAAETGFALAARTFGKDAPRVKQAWSALLIGRSLYDLKTAGQPLDPTLDAARKANDALMSPSG